MDAVNQARRGARVSGCIGRLWNWRSVGEMSPLGLAMVPTCSSASRPLRAASRCRCAAALTPTALVGRGGWPSRRGRKEKGRMLEIHAAMLERLGIVRPVLEEIVRHDLDLESPARRA